MTWEPAERVQKNDKGEFRALIGGEWLPVSKAQKNEAGQHRIELFPVQAATGIPAAPMAEPAFEKEAKEILRTTGPELILGHPATRFALGVAEPLLSLTQATAQNPVSKAVGATDLLNRTLAQTEQMKQAGMKAYGAEGIDWM